MKFWKDPKFWGLVISTVVTIACAWIVAFVPAPYTELVRLTVIAIGTIIAAMFGIELAAERIGREVARRLGSRRF